MMEAKSDSELDRAQNLRVQAQQAHAAGHLTQALQLLSEAIHTLGGSPDTPARQLLSILHSNRAALYSMLSSPPAAIIQDAQQAIHHDPHWPKPYLRLASGLLQMQQFEAALHALDQGLAACTAQASTAPVDGGTQLVELMTARADVLALLSLPGKGAKVASNGMLLKRSAGLPVALGPASHNRPAPSVLHNDSQATRLPTIKSGNSLQGPALISHCLAVLDAARQAAGQQPGPLPPADRVGITVISGFLGSGKTTLLQRILRQAHLQLPAASQGAASSPPSSANRIPTGTPAVASTSASVRPRFGVIVNDLAAMNVDGVLVQDVMTADAAAATASDRVTGGGSEDAHPMVQLSNGCICCGLRGDLLLEISRLLAAQPSLDYLIIESTGVGQPLPIAAAFASTDAQGRSLMDYIRIDCMVTVQDASRFTQLMSSKQRTGDHIPADAEPQPAVPASGSAQPVVDAEDDRPLAELLVEQLEFADVVLLNKRDLVSQQSDLLHIQHVVQGLNPSARVLATCQCDCPLTEVINTHRFEYERAQQAARWQQELLGHEGKEGATSKPETEVYGIHSMVFESRKPFHPLRLADFLHQGLSACLASPPPAPPLSAQREAEGVPSSLSPIIPQGVLLRSKGFFWLACCAQVAWEWSTAGAASSFAPYGEWLAGKVPRRLWPAPGTRAGWDPVWGDKCISLVFICQGKADFHSLRQQLESCLLTDQEVWQETDHQDGEEQDSADAEWWDREQCWLELPGAEVWAGLLPD